MNVMSRDWCGTFYGESWPVIAGVVYQVRQREMCPTTGREHYQFFLRFAQRKRFSTVQRVLPGAHLEKVKCPIKARLYCMKLETRIQPPIEEGIWETEEKKVSESILTQLLTKRPLNVIEDNPGLWRNFRALRELHTAVSPKREVPTKGILLYGATGTGKSRIAHLIAAFLPPEEVYSAPPDLMWHDGYASNKLVIVDEFRGACSISFLLRYIDRYPLLVPVKGGFVNFSAELVIFTSNLTLSSLYPLLDHTTALALHRRIVPMLVY